MDTASLSEETPIEYHSFEVDSSIITSLIHSQNGTVETALRELVMNSIDAGSSRCEIQIGKRVFSVADNGKGFPDRASVERYFKRFGEPHKEGDALMGRFRIGRGQIMSLAKVDWHSNQFQMKTDIKNKGLGFDLIEDVSNKYVGCLVSGQFYTDLNDHDLSLIKDRLSTLLKYVDCEIICNGIQLSNSTTDPWDYEDDDLKIRWKSGRSADGIYIYSLGVFVKEAYSHHYGISAEIVTKKALLLNMARNEIKENDALWIKISNLIRERSLLEGRKKAKSNRLDEATRKSLIRQFNDYEIGFYEMCSMPIFRDCRGHNFSLSAILNSSRPLSIDYTEKNRIAEKVASSKLAIVLHSDELRIWGEEALEDLVEQLFYRAEVDDCDLHENPDQNEFIQVRYLNGLNCLMIVPLEVVSKGLTDENRVLKTSDLESREKAARASIAYAAPIMQKRIAAALGEPINGASRKILIGESAVCDAWTDAATYIVIGRHVLPILDKLGIGGALQIAQLMLHEYCHDECDVGSHEHDFRFYEKFHDLSSNHRDEIIGRAAESLYSRYLSELVKRNQKLPESVHRSFKYPIVNELITYTGYMRSKGLSQLGAIILDGAAVNYKTTKTKIIVSANTETQYSSILRVQMYIENLARNSGMSLPAFQDIKLRYDNLKDAHEEFSRLILKMVIEWATAHGHDASVVERIFLMTRRRSENPFEFLLQQICADRNSDVVSFQSSVSHTNKILIGKSFIHDFRVADPAGRGRNFTTDSNDLVADNAYHMDFLVQAIKNIVSGITDEKIKKTFADTYFSDNLKVQLD